MGIGRIWIKGKGIIMNELILRHEDITQNINLGVDYLRDAIVKDGVITQEQADQIELYKVMIIKDNIFGKITSLLFPKGSKTYKFIVVKLIPDNDEDE